MTLDGFIAGPDDGVEKPLGEGGERIHQWLYDSASWRELHGQAGGETRSDGELVSEAFERTGAIVMGRRMYENGAGPNGWGDDPPFHKPVFVLTHEAREPSIKEDTTFTFVTGGIESALEQARVPRAARTSRSQAARMRFSSSSRQGCSTSYRFTSHMCSSAGESPCSARGARSTSNWRPRGS
jgi:dihydrofolate reductase